jgi:Styrene monooxygenase A putative substrate binding domain
MVTPRYRKRIGIIGAGIAGLHLGLRLRQMGIGCTIMTDRSPEQVATGALANAVVHWHATLEREQVLQVCHWPAEEFGFGRMQYVIQTPEPIEIRCRASALARAVDYRLYLPQLMNDFTERGGRLEVSALDAMNIGRIAARFDLVVVAMPGNGFSRLFACDVANSPYEAPQRHWLAGLYTGFQPTQTLGTILSIVPGHGEAVLFPMLSRTGMVRALGIGAHHPDELAMLRLLSRGSDRAGFRAALLRTLKHVHPAIHDQIDTARFDLQGPDDLVQVAITPTVRHPHAALGGGKYAIALGDVHITVDPLLAQGANIGSYSAFALADAIVESDAFDQVFCHEVERSRAIRLLAAARWTNAFLQPPDEARVELMVAMSRDRLLADEYFENFNCPERQWERIGSAERIRGWLSEERPAASRFAATALAPSNS